MEAEPNPQFADWVLYTGPMRIAVSDPGLDPDDDLVSTGPTRPPRPRPSRSPPDGCGSPRRSWASHPDLAHAELPAGSSAEQIVTAGAAALAEARAAAVAGTRGRGRGTCVSCGERFPQRHSVVFPTASEELARARRVCSTGT